MDLISEQFCIIDFKNERFEMHENINTFDFDGVITLGIYPGPKDVIITGRSFEERDDTIEFLRSRNIFNVVLFNRAEFNQKSRESSGLHKANRINELWESGVQVVNHFDDDEVQIAVIKQNLKYPTNIIHINHGGLVSFENKTHDEHMKSLHMHE